MKFINKGRYKAISIFAFKKFHLLYMLLLKKNSVPKYNAIQKYVIGTLHSLFIKKIQQKPESQINERLK